MQEAERKEAEKRQREDAERRAKAKEAHERHMQHLKEMEETEQRRLKDEEEKRRAAYERAQKALEQQKRSANGRGSSGPNKTVKFFIKLRRTGSQKLGRRNRKFRRGRFSASKSCRRRMRD
jgi:hypothetical protein